MNINGSNRGNVKTSVIEQTDVGSLQSSGRSKDCWSEQRLKLKLQEVTLSHIGKSVSVSRQQYRR